MVGGDFSETGSAERPNYCVVMRSVFIETAQHRRIQLFLPPKGLYPILLMRNPKNYSVIVLTNVSVWNSSPNN